MNRIKQQTSSVICRTAAGFFIKKAVAVLACILAVGLVGRSQKQIAVMQQSWLGVVQQVRLSERWGALADVQYRTSDHWTQGSNFLLSRVGATWHGQQQLQLSAGYGFVYFFGQNHQPGRNEHRLWQQVQWGSSWHKARLTQRVRLEERWREQLPANLVKTNFYQYQWRAGTQLQLAYPLTERKGRAASLVVAEELMCNLGKSVRFNTFDQNRLSAGLQLQLGSKHQLQATYMRIFQQLASGSQYRLIHCARVFYTHNLDLRHKS